MTWRRTRGYSFFSFLVGLSLEGELKALRCERAERGVFCREGVYSLLRCCEDGVAICGGVVSICIARTEEGFRKRERSLRGVNGDG